MKCPKCLKDDNCWIIRKDEVVHVSCDYRAKTSEMLDYVRTSYKESA